MVMVNRIERLVAEQDGQPELDLDSLYRQHGEKVSQWVKRLWGRHDAEEHGSDWVHVPEEGLGLRDLR